MGGYVGSAADGNRASMSLKERDALFARSESEKRRLADETAGYRLKGESDRFSSSSNAVDVALQQATVGLVTKEEFACRRMALEARAAGMDAGDAAASGTASVAVSKEKKKKKKESKGALSFALDDEDGDEPAVVLPKKKPRVEPASEQPAADVQAAADSAAAPVALESTAQAPAAPAANTAPPALPAGCTSIRAAGGGSMEISVEVHASAALPRSRVTRVSAHSIGIGVKASERGDEVNLALCAFLRGVIGGSMAAGLSIEVVRGHRAPVKVARLTATPAAHGAAAEITDFTVTPELAYQRLQLAQQYG